jgi:hypothetical protein
MMETADQGRLDDPALIDALHCSGLRCVLLQREVGPVTVVVGEVVSQQATQVGLVQHDHMIEALAAQGPDETFHVRILPRGPRGRLDFADPQGLDAAREHDTVDRIAVAQQVSWGGLPGERLHELLGRPLGRGASVRLQWATRRRSCARTTKTNKTLNVTVGTVKKSTETRLRRWLSRNVRHICDGGLLRRPRHLDTAACEISMPNFWSSP